MKSIHKIAFATILVSALAGIAPKQLAHAWFGYPWCSDVIGKPCNPATQTGLYSCWTSIIGMAVYKCGGIPPTYYYKQ